MQLGKLLLRSLSLGPVNFAKLAGHFALLSASLSKLRNAAWDG